MGSELGANKSEANLFFLSLLMSSILVYNSDKVFTPNDFEHLSSLLNLSERIKISKGNMLDSTLKKKLKEELPKFLWLLRNFQSNLGGLTIEKKLEKELEEVEAPDCDLTDEQTETINRCNKIRAQFKSSFKSIEAFKISRPLPPSSSTDDTQFIAELKDYDLDKLGNFGRDVSDFVNKVVKMCKESRKKIAGEEVKGSAFALFIKNLVCCLNSSETVYLHSTYELIIEQLSEEKVNAAKQLLQTQTDQIELPKESTKLKSDLDRICDQAIDILKSSLSSKELDKAVDTYKKIERNQIDLINKKNQGKIYAYNVEKVLDPKFNALAEEVKNDASIKTYEEFQSKLKKCHEFSASFFAGDEWKNNVHKFMESKKSQIDLLEAIVKVNSKVTGSDKSDQTKKGLLEKFSDLVKNVSPIVQGVSDIVVPLINRELQNQGTDRVQSQIRSHLPNPSQNQLSGQFQSQMRGFSLNQLGTATQKDQNEQNKSNKK